MKLGWLPAIIPGRTEVGEQRRLEVLGQREAELNNYFLALRNDNEKYLK